MTRIRPVRVVVVRNHVQLRSGQIIMHSEEYHDPAGARRAAKGLVKAINTRPMRLEYALRGKWIVEEVRKLWMSGRNKPVVLPVDGGPDQAYPPYFEPMLDGD